MPMARKIRARPGHGPFVLPLVLGVAASLAGPGVQAGEAACGQSAEQVFAGASPKTFEIFSMAINQYQVQGRILPRTGTGFRLTSGVILTNYHVIADARFTVVYDEFGSWDAEVVGADPSLDIAVLRIPTFAEAPAGLDFAPADQPRMGQKAYAIGFPRGLGISITEGIVSGVGRVLYDSTSSWLNPMIQTDATINPGNSGGPLLNDCGQVLGMVSRADFPDQSENIGYAIPASVLKPVVEEIIAQGHVSRPWHGLYGQMVTPPILAILGVPYDQWDAATGFLVETVEPGSAADEIGIRGGEWPILWGGHQFLIGGDIITEVNGRRIDSRDVALDVVRGLKAGETISLTYLREGEEMTASVMLSERPVTEADLDQYR